MTDTEKKIAEIREALEKATPRWHYNGNEIVSLDNPRVGIGGFLRDENNYLAANAPEWLRFLLSELERLEREYAEERAAHNAHVAELCELEKENRKMREELDAVAEGYRQQVKLAGELMDKLVFAQKREQRLIKKLREITKALGGVTFTDGRQWGAYNALCDILEENEKELSE
jgi:hypothetical protein